MADVETLLNRGLQQHQRNDLTAAEASYREVLRRDTRHPVGLHLLGLVLFQRGQLAEADNMMTKALRVRPKFQLALKNHTLVLCELGRLQDALTTIDKLVTIDRSNPEAHFVKGNVLQGLSRHKEAIASFDRVLAIDPSALEVMCRRALSLQSLGRTEEAIAEYDRVLEAEPRHAEALNNRGIVLVVQERYEEAIDCFDRLLSIDPASAEAQLNRGDALMKLGRGDEALVSHEAAVRRHPNHAGANYSRGRTLHFLGRPEEALECLERATMLDPSMAQAFHRLGLVLLLIGRIDEALAALDRAVALGANEPEPLISRGNALSCAARPLDALADYDRAIALDPAIAEAHNNRGNVLAVLKRHAEAIASYERAAGLQPEGTDALFNLGAVLRQYGATDRARAVLDKAVSLSPSDIKLKIARVVAELPSVYADEPEIEHRRASYARLLADLGGATDAMALTKGSVPLVGAVQPYYLAYQGRDDRDLQAAYGRSMCRLMEPWQPASDRLERTPTSERRLRVGIASGFFNDHSNWKIPIKGWVSQIDRRRFELFGYHTSARVDAETNEARSLFDSFHQKVMSFERWVERLSADRLDVLIYPEVGMDPTTAALAALRLAPVQCTSWGHPQTSGYPTLDYFLSADLMEPADAQRLYTEKLVRLPNLSIYYEPGTAETQSLGRGAFGLRESAVVYWCGQFMSKFLPQLDWVFPAIAREVGDCQFLFIVEQESEAEQLFKRRISDAFSATCLSPERHCVFAPKMDAARFRSSLAVADVFLDSLEWSGCNTTLESLAESLPIVTLQGRFMRGRHTSAMLEMMGLGECVAATPEEYVALAARIGQDKPYAQQVSVWIEERRERVCRDRACIEALEAFLDQVCGRSSGGPTG